MFKYLFVFKNLYIVLFAIVLFLILSTPWLIGQGIPIFGEEALEAIVIGLLFSISYIIYFLYNQEVKKSRSELAAANKHRHSLEERLDEAFRHIGRVNIQISEVRSIFGEIKKYPESKSEFKNILIYFSEKVLSLINVDWVLFRIIDITSGKTLKEYSHCRGRAILLKSQIDNKDLIDQTDLPEYTVLHSGHQNLNIEVYCIFPKRQISNETAALIKAIVNQLKMLFLIFTSGFIKNNR